MCSQHIGARLKKISGTLWGQGHRLGRLGRVECPRSKATYLEIWLLGMFKAREKDPSRFLKISATRSLSVALLVPARGLVSAHQPEESEG